MTDTARNLRIAEAELDAAYFDLMLAPYTERDAALAVAEAAKAAVEKAAAAVAAANATKTNYAMFTDEANAAVAAAVDAHPTPADERELHDAVEAVTVALTKAHAEVNDTAVRDEIYTEFVRRMNPTNN